jgi:linoleoyl-CoA desaturase
MQLDSTVDFARGNRFVTWYLGGLNYQTIHHLFPRISHIHYPALSHVVERICAEHGVAYRTTGTFFQALASHQRWLKRMGHGEGAVRASAVIPSSAVLPAILEAPPLEPEIALAG